MPELPRPSSGDRYFEKSGRRWVIQIDELAGTVLWIAWHLFERVSGVAPSEVDALSAVEHFLASPHRYTLARRAR